MSVLGVILFHVVIVFFQLSLIKAQKKNKQHRVGIEQKMH